MNKIEERHEQAESTQDHKEVTKDMCLKFLDWHKRCGFLHILTRGKYLTDEELYDIYVEQISNK